MAFDNYIEYIGYEDNFYGFLELLDDRLSKEGKSVKIWCNLEFLPKIKKYGRIIPVYYRKYSNPVFSIRESVKKGELLKVLRELFNRIKYRNYIKYLKCKKENIVPCFLNNNNGKLEVNMGVQEIEFKGVDNTIILRRYEREAGMFSNLLVILPYLSWAKDNNLNVYFDMARGDNAYRENEGENAWEYYYRQTGNKPSLSCGSIISELFELPDYYRIAFETKNMNKIISLHSIYEKYIKLNDRMFGLVDKNWNRILQQGSKILGVKFRGTDYNPERIPYKHPFQTTCEEMIERAGKFMEKYDYHYIYLCTEEKRSLDKFKEIFGKKVLNYDCKLIESYKSGAATLNQVSLVGKRKAGEDYIGSIMCLAKCDSILCSPNSGTYLTFVINGGKFEHVEIIDKGCRD